MDKDLQIVNKVEQSGIITLNLEEIIPSKEVGQIDIKEQLFQEFILKEKDFRLWIKEHSWEKYENKAVAVFCSNDAIVPTWAYMLITSALSPHTQDIYFTSPDQLDALMSEKYIGKINGEEFKDKRVVIKGCGDREISNHAYVTLSALLLPHVKSLMFGEPCSTVPVYKKR